MNPDDRDINYLLKTYQPSYVPGEQTSTEYNNKIKQQNRQKEKLQIAKDLYNETPFHLTTTDKKEVENLIEMLPNFRKLHGNASNETIILAFIFYTKIKHNTDIKIDKYAITRKYQLTHSTFEIIICRIAQEYLKTVNIIPRETKKYSHKILEKGEIK